MLRDLSRRFRQQNQKSLGRAEITIFLVVVLIIAPMLIDNGFNTRLSGVFN
jgi:hypothetical protein